MKEICADNKRRAYVVNLDPAAEDLPYDCDLGKELTLFVKLRYP